MKSLWPFLFALCACTGEIGGLGEGTGSDLPDDTDQPDLPPDRPDAAPGGAPDGSLPDVPDITPDRTIRVDGRRVLVDDRPIELRGVCWNPVGKGRNPPAEFGRFAEQDVALMVAAGINAVRTYEPITDRAVLDRLADNGIWVLMTVYAYGGEDEGVARQRVAQLKDHPAILMWLVGNEWNYNGLYTGVPFNEARDRLQRIAAALHAEDPSRPVATIYGELPAPDTIAAMPDIDVWGLNVYRGFTLGDLFDRWADLSGKPMLVSEYGADAWDARDGGKENLTAQGDAAFELTRQILSRSTARGASGVALGGTIFEWSDEWWKDGSGSNAAHDIGGIAPGGGPHPDLTFNEEWWGIVDVDRNPRPAYARLKELFAP